MPASTPAEAAIPERQPLGIYVHWPFCLSKCPYCDFNSHVRSSIDEGRWQRALLAELDHFAAELRDQPREVVSVFFGGGTPSLMPPAITAAILDRIAARWPLSPDLEVTLEANPTSVEAGRFEGFRAAGVNRLSLGVQSLNDAELRFLGRGHSAAEAKAAIRLAHRHFRRVNFDLIYARPNQTVADWRAELGEAIALTVGHLSLYQLTIEEGTAFHNIYRRGGFRLPDEETAAALYDATQEVCEAAGLPAYEVSNHAAPGEECRHNLVYWRYDDYLGIGPGAHGRITCGEKAVATAQLRKPELWLGAVERDGHGSESREPIDPADRAAEMLMMGLRLREGVDRRRFARRIGRDLEAFVAPDLRQALVADGYLAEDGGRLRVTRQGMPVLNHLLGKLLV